MSTATKFEFPKERMNMGVVLAAVRNDELNCSDEVGSTRNHLNTLELAIGESIPSLESQIERFNDKFNWGNIEELADGVSDEELENHPFDDKGYVDLEPYDLIANTLYLINFAYSFFNQIEAFSKQNEVSLAEYVQQCADHVTEELLEASQVLDWRFSSNEDCPVHPYMQVLLTQMENIKQFSNWEAMSFAHSANGVDGTRNLARFSFEMTDNLLTLNDEYAEGSYSYIY